MGYGRAFRIYRAASGLSRQELADRMGIHYSTLSRLERGVGKVSHGMVTKLLVALFPAPTLTHREHFEDVVVRGADLLPDDAAALSPARGAKS